MLDGMVIQAEARQEHADPGLRSIIVGAQLVELRDHLQGFIHFAKLKVRFGEKIKILRLVGMLLNQSGQFGKIQLRLGLLRQVSAIVQIVEKVLIRIGSGGSVLRKRLENTQVSFCCLFLMEAPLDHRQLVVSRSRIPAHLNVFAQQYCSLCILLLFDAKVGQFEQSVWKVRICVERLLKERFRSRQISLPLLNVTKIEQARCIMRLKLQTVLEVFACFFEAAEVPVRQSHERIGASGGVEVDQDFELVDGFLRLSGHEVAFTQGSMQIRPFGRDLQPRFEKRDRILEVVLRHADASQEENNVCVFWRQLVCPYKHIERIYRACLVEVDLT